jgi:chemotaxis protein CheC
MEEIVPIDQDLLEKMKTIAGTGITSAAKGFSGMLGKQVQVAKPVARLVPLLSIQKIVGGPDEDAVGIYLRFNGDLVGQMLMIIPHQKALELVDILMDVPPGTTQQLSSLEKSALGELGNICSSFFLNSLAEASRISSRPSPPAVMVDLVGAILDIVVATIGGASEQVWLVQANFIDSSQSVTTDFWIIPEMNSLQVLIKRNLGI